jgi:hypothetical protein
MYGPYRDTTGDPVRKGPYKRCMLPNTHVREWSRERNYALRSLITQLLLPPLLTPTVRGTLKYQTLQFQVRVPIKRCRTSVDTTS